MVAPPSEAIMAAAALMFDGTLLAKTSQTLLAAGGGLAVGFLLGAALGIFMGLFRTLDQLLEFSIESIRPVPAVALIPIFLLAFGFGYRLEIAIVSFAVMWPALILARAAVRDVEPQLFEVASILRLPHHDLVLKILLPAAAPRILVAFRLSLALALVVAVTVEVVINNIGLGNGMMSAMQSLHPDVMLAYLAWIGIVGYALNWATDLVLRALNIEAVGQL